MALLFYHSSTWRWMVAQSKKSKVSVVARQLVQLERAGCISRPKARPSARISSSTPLPGACFPLPEATCLPSSSHRWWPESVCLRPRVRSRSMPFPQLFFLGTSAVFVGGCTAAALGLQTLTNPGTVDLGGSPSARPKDSTDTARALLLGGRPDAAVSEQRASESRWQDSAEAQRSKSYSLYGRAASWHFHLCTSLPAAGECMIWA